jgi:hypothetical protein
MFPEYYDAKMEFVFLQYPCENGDGVINTPHVCDTELSGFEQLFKISETDILDIDLIEKNLSPQFFSNCLTRFIAMREDWNQLIN